MTVDVPVVTTISRAPAELAAYAGDPGKAPSWYARIKSVDWRTEPPMPLGSRQVGAGGAARDEDGRRTIPDGDGVHVGTRRRRRHPSDAAQPRGACGFLVPRATGDGSWSRGDPPPRTHHPHPTRHSAGAAAARHNEGWIGCLESLARST